MTKGRAPQQGLEPRDCVVCGTRFQPYRDFHVACGARPCRERARHLSPRRTAITLTCRGCRAEFEAVWSGVGRQPQCPSCTAAAAKVRQDRKNVARRISTDPSRREVNLRSALRKYGVTVERYREMVADQKGRCALCGNPPVPDGIKAASRLHVDHDHVTGAVRSLLCNRCNQGIGYFLDDPALFRAAAEYIERHRATN